MFRSRVERIMDWKSEYTGLNLGSALLQVGSSIVKCCHWVGSFSVLSCSDSPCFHTSLTAVHARDGEWKGKPTL